MTAIQTQTERKRQDRSARCAEKHRCRDRTRQFRGLIRPVSAACATTGAAQGEKRLSSAWIQAIFTSNSMPLGECRFRRRGRTKNYCSTCRKTPGANACRIPVEIRDPRDRIDLIGYWSGSVLATKRHGPLHLLQFSSRVLEEGFRMVGNSHE